MDGHFMMLILKAGDKTATDFGFGSAITTLCKGLNEIGVNITHDSQNAELQELSAKYGVDVTDYDIIVANDFFNAEEAVKLKIKTKKPLIASIHLSHPTESREKMLLDYCDAVIVYSKISKQILLKNYPGFEKPIEVVPLGIDKNRWFYKPMERDGHLMFAGRTTAGNKNFLKIVEKSIKECVALKVAGSVPENPYFEGKYYNQNELLDEYNKAFLHILPSSYEPFGLTTLEAMACGCPVAVSIHSGVAELLNEKMAIIFDPNEDFSLVDLMNRAKNADRLAISNYARQFDEVFHANEFMAAIKRLKSYIAIQDEIKRGVYDELSVEGKTVIDVGAFMGETANHFVKAGAKKVFAIEPFSSIEHIQSSQNIIPLRRAVAAHILPFILTQKGFKNDGESRVSTHAAPNGNCIAVPTLNMNKFLADENLKNVILKVDCEGDEDFIFNLTAETMQRIDGFMVEAHEAIHPGITSDLSSFFSKSGFSTNIVDQGGHIKMIYARKAV
jgi:FkbM family methyltransferase